jgi:hypothetical protein
MPQVKLDGDASVATVPQHIKIPDFITKPLGQAFPGFFASPKPLDGFKSEEHIGSLDGLNVYGWGIYFSECSQSALGRCLKPKNLYKVDIDAEHEDFLDWDTPFVGQSEKVKNVIKLVVDGYKNRIFAESSGAKIYFEICVLAARDKTLRLEDYSRKASHMLLDAGLQGIRYFDRMSRHKGMTRFNYVLFDDRLIQILHGVEPDSTAPR